MEVGLYLEGFLIWGQRRKVWEGMSWPWKRVIQGETLETCLVKVKEDPVLKRTGRGGGQRGGHTPGKHGVRGREFWKAGGEAARPGADGAVKSRAGEWGPAAVLGSGPSRRPFRCGTCLRQARPRNPVSPWIFSPLKAVFSYNTSPVRRTGGSSRKASSGRLTWSKERGSPWGLVRPHHSHHSAKPKMWRPPGRPSPDEWISET